MSSENATGSNPGGLVVGVGASAGAAKREMLGLITEALAEAALPAQAVRLLATVEARALEPGLLGAARAFGAPLVGHPAAELAAVPVPTPSPEVLAATGTLRLPKNPVRAGHAACWYS